MAAQRNGARPAELDFVYATYKPKPGAPPLSTGELGLLGTWEVAEYLGVERSRIARWIVAGVMPHPVARLKCGPLWTREQADGKLADLYREATKSEGEPSTAALYKWAKKWRARRATVKRPANVREEVLA